MNAENLSKILKNHKLWLEDEEGGIKANLSGANLSLADLSGANLSLANLSGAKGLLTAANYLEAHFDRTTDGYIVYKTFGDMYKPPENWKIEPGSIIEETANHDRCIECGSGINVAPLEWVKQEYNGDILKCLIKWEWLPGVVVPYMTDGRIRCEKLQLLEVVER